jgi:hypothetical protein
MQAYMHLVKKAVAIDDQFRAAVLTAYVHPLEFSKLSNFQYNYSAQA